MEMSALFSVKKKPLADYHLIYVQLAEQTERFFNEWAIFAHRKTDDQFWLPMLARD
jgi:hypothetical protein